MKYVATIGAALAAASPASARPTDVTVVNTATVRPVPEHYSYADALGVSGGAASSCSSVTIPTGRTFVATHLHATSSNSVAPDMGLKLFVNIPNGGQTRTLPVPLTSFAAAATHSGSMPINIRIRPGVTTPGVAQDASLCVFRPASQSSASGFVIVSGYLE